MGSRRSGVRERNVVTTEVMTAVNQTGVRMGLSSKSCRRILRLPYFLSKVAIW